MEGLSLFCGKNKGYPKRQPQPLSNDLKRKVYGSGSNESDSLRLMPGRLVVLVQEYPQTSVVHHINLRE